MSVFAQLASRQLSLSGRPQTPLPLRWLYGDLCCHSEDELYLQGGMTMGPTPPFASKFTPDGLHGNLLAVGDEEGSVRLFDTRRSLGHSEAMLSELHAHSNAIFDLAWVPGGTKLLTGSGDRSIALWDVVGMTRLATFKAHLGSVKSVDVRREEPSMFVSGSRDGSIRVWDTRCATKGSQHRAVNRISMAHKKSDCSSSSAVPKRRGRGLATPSECQHGVTAVLFHGDGKLASAGAVDGVVKLWDLRRTYSTCRVEPPPAWHVFHTAADHSSSSSNSRSFGFTSLVSDSYQSSLFACCTNDIIYQYSTSTLSTTPVRAFSGHKSSSFYVKTALSGDGRHLLSGSSCGRGFLWEVARPEAPPLTLCGHSAEVTAVDWCPTLDKIVTCSDDNDVRIWRVVRGGGRATSASSGLPEDCIGSCQVYDGKGHLKALETLDALARETDPQGPAAVPLRLPLQGLQEDARPVPYSAGHTPSGHTPSGRSAGGETVEAAMKRNKKETKTLLHFLQRTGGGGRESLERDVGISETAVSECEIGSTEAETTISSGDLPAGKHRELTPENQSSGANTRATNSTKKRKLLLDTPPLLRTNDAASTKDKEGSKKCAVGDNTFTVSRSPKPNSEVLLTKGADIGSLPHTSTSEPPASYPTGSEVTTALPSKRAAPSSSPSSSLVAPPCKRQRSMEQRADSDASHTAPSQNASSHHRQRGTSPAAKLPRPSTTPTGQRQTTADYAASGFIESYFSRSNA